ncbi:DNA segregation ATPase FtsK/SpoIIIE [Pseudomonas aeruginosa]|nr:DNA segregation ATPase FtsK/SpoIIIE [Pseudomonas aeruginosa]CRQ79849.1 DNA segregation ATPase FtsK/SpoIIIE [Pseudomonas aeruginosa]
MADGDEHAIHGDLLAATIAGLQAHAGDAHRVAKHLIDLGVELEHYLAFGDPRLQLVLENLLGAEGFATMHQGHPAGDVGQVQGLFDSGIAAADHRHFAVAVEETVAGGAGRHALAHERLLRRQPQVARAGTGGDDQCVAGVGAIVAAQGERLAGQVHGMNVVEDDLGLEALGVLLHPLHQCRAGQAVGIARPVVDLGGGGQLAAGLHAGDQQRLEVGARGVDSRAVTGGTGTEDDHSGVAEGIGHLVGLLPTSASARIKTGPPKHMGKAWKERSPREKVGRAHFAPGIGITVPRRSRPGTRPRPRRSPSCLSGPCASRPGRPRRVPR